MKKKTYVADAMYENSKLQDIYTEIPSLNL